MRLCYLVVLSACLAGPLRADPSTPPPLSVAQLLPTDTLAMVSVLDWDKATAYWNDCPQGKLWHDIALKPFRDKVLDKWRHDIVAPLERQLGVPLSDYADVLHGQVTVALTQNGWGTDPVAPLGFVLLIDTKDRQPILKAHLNDLKKRWIDSGKQLKTERIRDVEFITLLLAGDDLSKLFDKVLPGTKPEEDDGAPAGSGDAAPKKAPGELTLGCSGPLLMVGNSAKTIEKILAHQQGGILPSLADQAAYQSNQAAFFRETLAFAWLNLAPVFEVIQKQWAAATPLPRDGNPPNPHADRLLSAIGLGGVSTLAARLAGGPEGTTARIFVKLPEQQRRGLFKLLALDQKDSAPPPFVSSDVIKFSRWRVDGQNAWRTLENALSSLSPEVAGLIQMGLDAAGKERDPNFDLKKTLTSSLGDDFISITKNPRLGGTADPGEPASLYLLGSPNPEQLVQALKAGSGLMPLAGGEPNLQEREFLGHRIYALGLAGGLGGGPGKDGVSMLNFAAGGGYVAISGDPLLVEAYLRGNEPAAKALSDLPGLREAAQKVGSMTTLYFAYQNQAETARAWLDGSRRESAALSKLLSLAPLSGGKAISAAQKENMAGWLDPALLPPFEKIAKYFSYLLYSLSSSSDGLTWRFYAPTPPTFQ